MLTESRARELLHAAADTVQVGPTPPFVPPPRRSLYLVLAAAVAVAAIAAGGLVIWRGHRVSPVDHPAGTSRVPSLVGYPAEAALARLRQAGFDPRVRHLAACQDWNRTLRTDPLAGTVLRRGSRVVLDVGVDPVFNRCPAEPDAQARVHAWQIVDLARGLPGPRFAAHVVLSVNQQAPVMASAAEAAEPTRWPDCHVSNDPRCPESALDLLRITLGYALNSRQYLVQPQFWAEATLRDGSIVTFGASDGGVPRLSAPVWSVTEALNPAGEVTSVHLDYRASPGNGESHGAPAASVIGGDSTGFGHRFVDFALGRSTSFPVDTPVALYFGNVYRRTLSNKDAQNIRTWRTCAAYAGHRCPPSAVATIAAYEQATGKPVRLGRGGVPVSACLARSKTTPTGTGGTQEIVVTPSAPTTCRDDFRVELWINDVGQVVAVNELLGVPRTGR